MKNNQLILIILLFCFQLNSIADEGDTIIIQTIDYETAVLPGWNSPRSGTYEFPSDTASFSKILMYYKLKCDPSQSPACGEWDYTTHTRIIEHTGEYDSNLYAHPNYMVNNQSPDSFMLMHDTSYYYHAVLEYFNLTPVTNVATPGQGGGNLDLPFNSTSSDGRGQFLYKASELNAAGLNSGELTGLSFNILSGTVDFTHFQIRIKATNLDSLHQDSLYTSGLISTFNRNTTLSPSNNTLPFSFPYNWDGVSNLIIDISYARHNGFVTIESDNLSFKAGTITSESDSFLDFEGWDYLSVPQSAFQEIDSAITISFWQYGNPVIQPINTSIFEGIDSDGHRILNVHLPWSNERIYWDAGWDDGNDRIDKPTYTPADYEGRWNHYAFTKDLNTGLMQIYLNGNLWAMGSGRYRPMSGIINFRIGAALNNNGYYAGSIDEFRIWNKALAQTEIQEWMHKDVVSEHPDYQHLKAYYKLNEGVGLEAFDNSSNSNNASQFGLAEWKNYQGANRVRNGINDMDRPHLSFENGVYNASLLDSLVVVDTFPKPAVNIVIYDPDNPTQAADTLTKWPSYYHNYSYDAGGFAVDSSLVAPDSIIYRLDYPYYGNPYELTVPWEIARFITPYGNNLSLGDGFTWVYDVTDYVPLLRDSVHITAGNFQELLDLKFYMIEGTPPREVLKVEKVFSGNYSLKHLPTQVPPDTIALLANAETFRLRARTSGHLFSNPTNCAEFCAKVHSLTVNNDIVKEWQILQECSDNPLYPQGGTWIYDRAGWCPGDKVKEQEVEITSFINSDTVIIDYNSEADEYGNYSLELQLLSYGPINFSLDAAIDEVIAPNSLKRYGRFNPSTSAPIVVIQNRGADTLSNLVITYGPEGSSKVYNWTGKLGFMDKEEVKLEAFNWSEWVSGDGRFQAVVSQPNGAADENPINDHYSSRYEDASVYPSTIVIKFKTNKVAYQNRYEIRTNDGELVFEKDDFENQTVYSDTITLLGGCYDFRMFDSGDNGISFWANSEGSGYLKFYDIEGNLLESFGGDFGDQIYKSFFADVHIGFEDKAKGILSFDVIPNPNDGRFHLSYALNEADNYNIQIINSQGQTVWESKQNLIKTGKIEIQLEKEAAGVYSCVFTNQKVSLSKKFIISR